MASTNSFFADFKQIPQKFWHQEILPVLADLRLAIVLLLVIAIASISGTVIEQGQTLSFYQANYPENPALFGFLSWKVILNLGLNGVYKTWWFLGLLILFGSSLTACTFTRQFPALNAAQKWKFYEQPRQFEKLALSAAVEASSPNSLIPLLEKQRYQVFREDNKIYARKGIVGRIGPIIVHASMLMILAGSIWGSLGGLVAQEIISSGATFKVKNIIDRGPLANNSIFDDWSVKVNRFWIDYTSTGQIDQFYSDLSVLSSEGKELDRQTIYVNKPLKYHGVTLYQTDWGIAGVKFKINNSPILQLPMAPIKVANNARLWGTWIPIKPDLSEGVSLLAKDLQGTLLIYDNQGKLVSTVRSGMTIPINGMNLTITEVVGSTGLQIKSDPGIPLVYLGFGLLMISVMMSYVSHSQVWILETEDKLYIGGKTNRAQVTFEREILAMLDEVETNKLIKAV
jgi:cytochrome c biogenesis protein